MKLDTPGAPHLTYCTNIHPGESWADVRANVERYVTAVRARVAPDRPFGVGLRLSAAAAQTLSRPAELEAFQDFLRTRNLYVFTVNGFPYGRFHGTRVKEAVYLPDWLDEERLAYSNRLAELLAALLPAEMVAGSVSTVPGAFKERVTETVQAERMADMLVRHAAALHGLHERTGKRITLALEPEPCCYLETVAETIRFFEDHLFSSAAVTHFMRVTGLSRAAAEAALRRHLGVCFDACHVAVEFEDPRGGLEALRAAGIGIGKIQLSAGLRVPMQAGDRSAAEGLRAFAEGVYLHQVVERCGGELARFTDLPDALAAFDGNAAADREWRVHFHVPLFQRALGAFSNTQDDLAEVLGLLRQRPYSPHLEVETYTWDVLPPAYRRDDIVTAVARELGWVLERLRP